MDLDWDEDEVTKPTGTALLPIVPINPRIRIIGSTKVLGSGAGLGPGAQAKDEPKDEEPVPTTREFLTGTPEEREFDERETTEREKVSPQPQAIAPEEDSGILVAPIVSVEGPPPSSRPTWDDMTVPRHARDLRERARRLAAMSKEGEEASPDESDRSEGPDTRVDESADTQQDVVMGLPVVAVEGHPDAIAEAAPRQPSMRILSFDQAPPTDAQPRRDDLPVTVPRASAHAPRSVEVDLSSLDPYADTSSPSELSAPAATPAVLSHADEDEEIFPKPQTDWLPLEEHAVVTTAPVARRPQDLRSVPPVTMSSPSPSKGRRRGIAIAAFGVMLILCSTIFLLWMFPKKGAVLVRLRTEDGHPAAKAEIYVDGQKRCDTDPCLIEGLPRGDRTIKVIVPGSDEPRVANVEVQPGAEETVWIDVPSTVQAQERDVESEAEAVPPSLTVSLVTGGARVVLIPDGGMGKVVEGPFPRKLELPLGRYEIVASLSGYSPFVDHVTLSEEVPTAEVDVRLVKRGTSAGREDESADDSAEAPRVQKHSPYWDPYADVEWD